MTIDLSHREIIALTAGLGMLIKTKEDGYFPAIESAPAEMRVAIQIISEITVEQLNDLARRLLTP